LLENFINQLICFGTFELQKLLLVSVTV